MEEAWWGGAERAGKGKSLRQLRLAGWVKAQGGRLVRLVTAWRETKDLGSWRGGCGETFSREACFCFPHYHGGDVMESGLFPVYPFLL